MFLGVFNNSFIYPKWLNTTELNTQETDGRDLHKKGKSVEVRETDGTLFCAH